MNRRWKWLGSLGGAAAMVLLAASVWGQTVPETLTYQITDEMDDVEEQDGSFMYFNSSDLELGFDGAKKQVVGLRFPGVAIGACAKVVRAYIQFTSDETSSTATTLTIRAEASDDAPVYATANGSLSARPKTSASVTWTPPAWTAGLAGAAQQTPDLSVLVREVVSRPGWVSGNAIAFTIEGDAGKRTAKAINAKLVIEVSTGAIDFDEHPCFQKTADLIHQETTVSGEYERLASPSSGHTYDYRGQKVSRLPASNLYQVEFADDICVAGPTAIGTQSRSLTWEQMKASYDSAGLYFYRPKANADIVVVGLRVDNVEDGLSMPRSLDSNGTGIIWRLEHAWMSYIRDDAVENDSCLRGVIRDTLVDNTQMGFAARPGSSTAAEAAQDASWDVDGLLMHLGCKPDSRVTNHTGQCPTGTSVAQLFKTSACFGTVTMRNSVLRVDAVSRNGPGSMGFPPGTYENVTLVWLGPGDYPAPLPPGVTQTKDIEVWNAARADWLARHGCGDATGTCAMLQP